MLASCILQGRSEKECYEEEMLGIVVEDEGWYRCPWDPPQGWADCDQQ
jgi:hypothetical protein